MRLSHITGWILCFLFPSVLFAQGKEGKLPLSSYRNCGVAETPVPVIRYYKAGENGIFPLSDWFNNSGNHPSDMHWVRGHARKLDRSVVFNAQDSTGQTYSGTNGKCDVLRSKVINLFRAKGNAFVYFTYSTGQSWLPTDSLVLRLRTGSGNYTTIWTSPPTFQSSTDIILNIEPLADFLSAQFDLEFVHYGNQTPLNTESFLLHQVNVASRYELPFYENFFLFDSIGKLPLAYNWMRSTVQYNGSIETGQGTSNSFVFDAFDESGQLHRNGSGTYGATDTLMSFTADLNRFALSDSVYLRFYYKALSNAMPGDSLLLECRNNTGIWVPVWRVGGEQGAGFKRVITQVNAGKLRSPNFQFRLISFSNASNQDTLKFAVAGIHLGRKLEMPFIDDFSTTEIIPDQKKWTGRQTMINNHFPIRPPSHHVATFDALDHTGNPYQKPGRYSDTLCSAAINLAKLNPQDSGVYLSFQIQPKGLGDLPNSGDSLLLEFRSSATESGVFVPVWSAARANFPTDRFTKMAVKIDSSFLHDDFQFRFKNISSRYGNLNHWHVDYVRLDNAGKLAGSTYYDIAVSTVEPSLLTPYTSMPYDHYSISPAGFMRPVQYIGINNNDTIPKPVKFGREVFGPDGLRIDSLGNSTGNVAKDTLLPLNGVLNLTGALPADSLIFKARYYATTFVNSDDLPFNDTLSSETVFSNYYAYDDGSAENGYAIMNTTGSVALAYNLAKPDMLYGVSMFFNQSVSDVSQRTFDLMIWRNINTNGNGTGEDVLARYSLLSPVYSQTINGFYYYQFQTPIALPAGKFYIGWKQTQIYNLNIGLDENFSINGNPVNPNLYYFLDDQGLWTQTELTGALMMRPIIGKWLNPPTGAPELHETESFADCYPNPAQHFLEIRTNDDQPVGFELSDLTGRVLLQNDAVRGRINLPDVPDGIYLVRLIRANGQNLVKKIAIIP